MDINTATTLGQLKNGDYFSFLTDENKHDIFNTFHKEIRYQKVDLGFQFRCGFVLSGLLSYAFNNGNLKETSPDVEVVFFGNKDIEVGLRNKFELDNKVIEKKKEIDRIKKEISKKELDLSHAVNELHKLME